MRCVYNVIAQENPSPLERGSRRKAVGVRCPSVHHQRKVGHDARDFGGGVLLAVGEFLDRVGDVEVDLLHVHRAVLFDIGLAGQPLDEDLGEGAVTLFMALL